MIKNICKFVLTRRGDKWFVVMTTVRQ